jgi:hypothetical protein
MFSVPVRDQFENFINLRSKKLILVPESPCTHEFHSFLIGNQNSHLANFSILELPSMADALDNCCEGVWAIIEIDPVISGTGICILKSKDRNYLSERYNYTFQAQSFRAIPGITIRMHPSVLPDTRNLEWSPLKGSSPRQYSGELMYFTSGFLTLQLEVQRFLQLKQQLHPTANIIPCCSGKSFIQHKTDISAILQILATSKSPDTLQDQLLLSGIFQHTEEPLSVYFPLFHRAYPTHKYREVSQI